jgi:quercetin dioxygenase-like cupin family protein
MQMAERSKTFQELDDAIEAMMANPDQPLPAVTPRLAALLRIVGDLRDLPSREFRERLKAQLLSGRRAPSTAVPAHYGKPLMTVADYLARLDELKSQPQFLSFDLATALSGLPERGTRFLTSLNQCTLGVSYFAGDPHWECHPAADELLHILDGEAEVETVTEAGLVSSGLRPGSLFICPQGLWHRVRPRSASVSMFFATPGEGTMGSDAKRPPPPHRGAGRSGKRELIAHDLRRALSGLPELAISAETTAQEADAATRSITSLGPCTLGVMRYSGLTPWERHPDGDELLHVLEGAVDVTVLTDDGPRQVSLDAGAVFVCPKGLWHRQLPRPSVTMLYGTPTKNGEASFADDPRVGDV